MYHCLWYHPVPPLFPFFFFYLSFLLICKHIPCFFSMGRVSIETQITRESIGKIDNQMSSGIELKLVAIHRPDYYTLFFSPRYIWTRFWAQKAIPHQTSTKMTHLKVCMIIISCRDCTLHFNVFITTYMGALVRLWKGGKHLSSWEGQKWQCGSHLFPLGWQSLGNLSWKFKSLDVQKGPFKATISQVG